MLKEKKSSILVIGIMCIVIAMLVVSFMFNQGHEEVKILSTNEISSANAALNTASDSVVAVGSVQSRISAGTSSITYGGTTYKTADSNLVQISTLANLTSFLGDNSDKYGYLTTNITLTSCAYISYTLAGILDGNGYTITLNASSGTLNYTQGDWTDECFNGGLAWKLTGTVMNMTYKISSTAFNLSKTFDDTTSRFCAGGMFGIISSGAMKNVYVDYSNSAHLINSTGEVRGTAGNGQNARAGGIAAEVIGTSTIEGCQFVMNNTLDLYFKQGYLKRKYYGTIFVEYGLVIGSVSGNLNLTNFSLTGSKNTTVMLVNGNGGTRQQWFGGIIGTVDSGTTNINGLYYGWTGTNITTDNYIGVQQSGSIVGNKNNSPTITFKSIYGPSSNTYFIKNQYTIDNSTITISGDIKTSFAYGTEFGFMNTSVSGYNSSYFWVKCDNSYASNGTSGNYVKSIYNAGTTETVYQYTAPAKTTTYAYLGKTTSTVQATLSISATGSYKAWSVNSLSKTYDGSSFNVTDFTFTSNAAWTGSDTRAFFRKGITYATENKGISDLFTMSTTNKDAGTYTALSKRSDVSVNDYCYTPDSGSTVYVFDNISTSTYTINKKNLIISSSSYTGTYDGNSHNITLNGLFSNSGYVNGETLSSLLSSGYATVSVGSLSGTSVTESNFNNLAITSVSDSVKSIPISISFTNYSINNANSYSKTETITINPVNLTITTSDYSNSYDGAIHGIQTTGNIILNNEIQSSGYVNGETLASIIQNGKGSFSVSYNSVADTTPNTTISGVDAVNGYSSLAISHVKDSVRTIQINLSLVDYTINSTSHDFTSTNTITITPASLTLDETIVKDYEYSGYSLYENSAITDRGYEFYNSVLQAAQTSGSPGLSLLNYDQMIRNGELTFTSSATTVLDVNSYTFTVQASSSSTGSAEADFTLQGEHTFSYNITKGTTILSITLIGNSDVSTYTGTSNTASGSKVYNDQNEPIPTANITLNNGGKSLGEATKTVLKDNSTYYLENAKKAGVYKVTYNFAGTNNYEAVKLVYTYTIDKATTYIEFTTIGDKLGAGVSKQVTSGNFSESKKFDFDAVTIPTAYVRWYTGNDGSTGVREETISYTSTASIQPGSNVSDAGVYDITWSYSGGDNLTACSCTYTYTIEKNTITFGFANSTGSQQLQSYALSVSTLLGSSYGNLAATLKNSKGQTIQVITAGVSQKSKVSLTSSSTYTSLYPGNETSFTGTEVQDCGTYKLIYSMTTSDTNYTVTTNPATYTFTISQRRMYLQFNDTKDLYDSIIDTTGNYYDFIFVSGADNISKINSVAQDYSSYFTKIVEWGSGVGSGHNFKDYLTLTAGVTDKTPVGNYYFSVEWNESATNKTVLNRLRNNYKAGVLDSSNVVIGTTGSGYSAGYTSYCESAKNTGGFNAAAADSSYEIRIRIVSNVDKTLSYTDSQDNWSILDTGSASDVITFINGHYYDSDEYAKATSATITSLVYINRAFDGSRIMASYKTLNGNSNTCEMKMWNETYDNKTTFSNNVCVTAQITSKGVYTHASEASTSETGYTGTYDQGYPAYTTIDGEKYYAASSLVALNYGVIKGFTFKWYVEGLGRGDGYRSPRITIEGHHNRNSAVGTISGINCGYITGCKIYYQRLLTFKGTSSRYNFAAGLDVGINNGYMSNNTFEFVENTENDTRNGDATHKYRVHFGMVGVASSGYFGLVCGINGSKGTIENITKEGTNVPFSVEDFTGTIYGGGFVGKNVGILNNLSFTNIASTLNTIHDSAASWTGGSGDGSITYPFKGYELRFYASADVYAGGIVGYSTGEINNCKYNSGTSTSNAGNLLATAGSGNTIALGGIVGYIGGGGKVNACSVKNYGCIYAGSDSVIVNAYALGGVVGVSSGGEVDGSSISNYGTIFGRASGAGNNYAGCFLGIGCEDGNGTTSAATYTSSNRVKFGTTNVEPGVFTASTSFNYGTIGANWGSWGYITGKYNTILSDSISDGYDYAHTYGGLIWYTNNTPSEYTKCLFGSVASILGDNSVTDSSSSTGRRTLTSTNVYITGIAGINIGDCGDGTLGNQLLDNVSLNTETGEINISYNSIKDITQTNAGSASFYYGMDASVNGNTVYITPNGGSKVAYTDNLGAGVFTMSTADANAIITDTTVEATISTIRVRTYLYIGSYEEYKDFVQNTGSSNYSVYRYCAGYGTLSTSMETGSIVWSGVLNEYKTFDGANKTITYTTNAAVSVSAVSGNWNGANIYILGTLLGANNGHVKSVNIVVTTSADNSYFIFDTVSGVNNVYGVVAGANSGIIEYCNVTIKGGGKVGLTASASTSSNNYSIGGIAGVSSSSITHCNVKFEDNTRLGLMSGTYTNGTYATVGGIVGAQFRGEVSNCVVVGKGYILTENSTSSDIVSNPNGFVGGIGGYLLVVNDRDFSYMKISLGTSVVKNVVVALFGGIESASTSFVNSSGSSSGVGGTGYISGRGTACSSVSSYNTLKNLDLGACFIIGTGEPTVVDWKAAAVQNTIFGGITHNEHKSATSDSNKDEYVEMYWYDIPGIAFLSLNDYSIRGKGVAEMVSSATIYVTFPTTFFESNISAGGITVYFYNQSNGKVKLSLTSLALTVNSNATYINTVITNISKDGEGTPISSDQGTSTSTSLGGYTAVEGTSVMLKLKVSYSVSIAGEEIKYDSATSLVQSPFYCFISGRGNRIVYAGAKEATLTGNITYDKKVSAAIEFAEGKVLNGNGNTFYSYWSGRTESEGGNYVAGLTDGLPSGTWADNGYDTVGGNRRESKDYPYWYELNGKDFYGVSDLISINRGTIKNLNISYRQEKGKTHDYAGMNADTAYGAIAGINLGTIENCTITYNCTSVYIGGGADYTLVMGAAVGINKGTINGLTVNMASSFTLSGSIGNNLFSSGVGINYGDIYNIDIVNTAGVYLTATSDGNSSTVAGGIVAINNGGSIKYARISGEGQFKIGTYTKDQEVDSEGTVLSTSYTYSTKYLYFAVGIAISNNGSEEETLPGLVAPVASCIKNNDNPVDHIIIDYGGDIYAYAQNYMTGIAFAHAGSSTTAEGDLRYGNIFWNSDYNTNIALAVESTGGTNLFQEGTIASAGFPLMGYTGNTNKGDFSFVKGAQIYSNVEENLSWDLNTGNLIFSSTNYAMSNSKTFESFESLYMPSLDRQYDFVGSNNTSDYYTFTKGSSSSNTTISITEKMMDMLVVDASSNYSGGALRVNIEFFFPYVEINDIYQLVQYIWFTSDDTGSDKIFNYYLRTYETQIKQLIDAGEKQASTATPVDGDYSGAWCTEADWGSVSRNWGYTADTSDTADTADFDARWITYNGANYYILLEKYCSNGDILPIYSSNNARLTSDIVLDKYTYADGATTMNVDFGFNCTSWKEYASSKKLDGQNYSITIVASDYNHNSGSSLGTTSKWAYVKTRAEHSGSMYSMTSATNYANNYSVNYVPLQDIANTPGKGSSGVYIYGGFLGIIRGEISNVNFILQEYSLINIVKDTINTVSYEDGDNKGNSTYNDYEQSYSDSSLNAIALSRSIFAGVVAGYITGKMDSCSLTMGQYSQIYVNKFGAIDDDNSIYHAALVGGYCGLLGVGAQISNSSLFMEEGVNIGVRNTGIIFDKTTATWRKGTIRAYAGGFAGMMVSNSLMYNLVLEGDSTSKIFAFTDNRTWYGHVGLFASNYYASFDTFASAAGGVVGCNTNNSYWNKSGLGHGLVDGVIFNWAGASISMFNSNTSTDYAGKEDMSIYYIGGNIAGVVGDGDGPVNFSISGNTETNEYVRNLYYVYELSSYKTLYQETGDIYGYANTSNKAYATKGPESKPIYLFKGLNFCTVSNYTGKYVRNSDGSYSLDNTNGTIKFSGTSNYPGTIVDGNLVCVSEAMSGSTIITARTLTLWKLETESVIGTGISYTGATSTKSGNNYIYESSSYNDTNFKPSNIGYKQITTGLSNIMSWADTSRNSNVKFSFEVDDEDTSSVMWAIDIYKGVIDGNSLRSAENTISEIPVYAFATSLQDSLTYKKQEYTIIRGQGDGMKIMYCTGSAASLSPNKTYYTNEVSVDKAAYYATAAIMYDGSTDAANEALTIYDSNGNNIERLETNIKDSIVTTAKNDGDILRTVYKQSGNTWNEVDSEADLTAVGYYKVIYEVLANEDSYGVINPNAYVNRDYRTQFFSSDGSTSTYLEDSGNYLVETYTLYVAIAPVYLNITEIKKVYDGSTDFIYKGTNYSSVTAQVDQNFAYAKNGTIPSVSCSNGVIKSSVGTNVQITLDATYDNAEIGNRSITLKTEGTVSYVYWQKNSEGKWIECSVESPLLKSSNSSERKAYFSLTILNSELSSTDGTKTYGYKDSLASGYTITNGSTVTSFDTSLTCKVHIDKANAPTITVTDPTLSYVYTGKSIEYGVEWASHITITDQFGSVLDPESMINNKELTITGDGTAVKDVKASGYTIKFTIAYTGTKYGNTTTESEVTIFVTPALLTITKAVKEYDGKNDVSVASFAYKAAGKTSGLYEQDKITFAGTYASSDVASSLNVKITTSQTTINGTQYKIVGDNYYLENDTINGIGVIYPTSAEIVLANKDYDKTNTVTYTGSGDINKTSILIKTTSSSVLGVTVVDVEPTATYSNSNVGNCNLQVSLNTFTYVNEKGASVTLYRLEDSNYCIENATSTSYTATGKAYIIPVNMTISYIYKTYDGTTAFPDDDANYMLSNNNNEFTKVDGSFSDANVKYENNKYNDINVSAVAYTYMYVSNGTTASNTVYRVQSSGSATNYTLDATLSGSTYVVEGIGVIIPKLVTIKNVTKLYDGKNTFDTDGFIADKGEKWEIVDESGASVNYHLVGTMGTSSSDGKNATNGKNLYQVNLNGTSATTPCVATFTFNGVDYIWLHYMRNTNNNYYVTSTTIAGIGDVLQRTINVAASGTGTLSSLSFTVNSKVNTSGKVNIQSGSASATYLFGQYYSIDNLTATFNWSGSSPKLSNGKLKVDGSTLTFKLKYNGSDANVTNARSYTFTLSLVTTSSNFAFNDYTIRLTINKRALSQSEITVTLGAITKVYDGTDSTDNIEVGTPSIKAVAQGVSSTEDVTLSGTPTVSSLTATDMINVKADENGEIQSYDATAVVTLSNFTSTNYTFSGSITTSVKYKITPYELTLTGAYEKEFNGTSTGITLNGINSEIVEVSYSGIGTLPGTYSQVTPTEAIAVNVDSSASENNKDNSIPANYTINVGVIDLTIKPATIIAERQYGADSFNVAVAITNLEGFDFLKEYKDAQDAAILSDTIVSDIASNLNSTTYKTELKSALIAAFAIRGNNAAWTNFETSNISSINIYSDTLEFIFTGLSELDTTSLTDRYSFAMYNNEKKTSGSNIAISSSELSDGQYKGTYTTTGTAVSTAEELVALINGGNDGYLTNNIYGFDATSLTTTTYSGTLYGNGYSIVLSGNFNISETSAALFIPTLQGNLYDINFKYATNAEINEELTSVGLVVNTNNGTISNCSLELLKDLTLVKDEEGTLLTKATVGGFANTSTGTLTNVTIVYSASETYSLFAGLAYTASGTINYVSARNSIYTTSVAGKTMFNTLSVTVDYAIDAITFAHTTLNSGSITTIYDTSSTYLAFYENNYTDGYLDYYFTLESKYTTDNAKHNEYVNGGSDNTNTTYYKDYRNTTSQTPILAIEVIAPLGDFIWAAFGVDYTEYKTNLNRAVGIFNTQDELTSITSYTEANNISYTIFKPIIGAVAGVKIAAGIDTIIEKEYSGSVQKAEFASEDNTKTFVISGTEVGTYTTYLDGASSEGGTAVSGYDVERFIAEIVTGESGEEKIMLIITPKQLTDTPTITKEYDSTTIAETELKAKDTDATASLYAVGEYSESKVGIGYNVSYYSTSKAVAAVNVSGTYKFITYRAYNTDENGNIVYIVEFIDIDGANFTSATNVTTANVQSLARAYYQLVTVDQINSLAYKTYEAGITQDNITSVYVYDLTFSHTVDSTKSNAESSVVYGTEIYYTNTVYNIGAQGEKVYNKNYNYLASTSNTFTGVSIMASTTESTSTSFVVSNEGSITKRTINANFSNLDQSYRTELSSIGVEIGEVSSLTNIPHSLSSDDLQTLISNINTELESAEFTEDILATVSADYVTKDNGKYYATQANTYVKVKLENPTTPISVSNNLAVTISGDNYLTLRYFAFDKESNRFIIDTFEALLMIDNLSDGNNGEYQTLDYIVTNDLYGRSQLVTTFTNEFSGTIDGNSKTIKNFVLVGNTSTGLFGTLSNTASIEKLTFAQVLVIASDVASMSVVSTNNNGSLDNIKVEAEFVSDKNATVKVVANNNSGTTTNSTAFVQTSMVSYSVEAESSSTNDIVVLERTYNVKNLDNIITKVTINGLDTNSTTSSAYTLSDISENVINLAILGLNNTGLTIENKVVKINNFREYWAYVNICPFLSVSAEDLAGFIGVEFEI